jgi:RecA-family ATPase
MLDFTATNSLSQPRWVDRLDEWCSRDSLDWQIAYEAGKLRETGTTKERVLVRLAAAWPDIDPEALERHVEIVDDAAAAPKWDAPEPSPMWTINPVQWEGQPVPRREWIVDQWLPVEGVTINFGNGGSGKTQLMMQSQTSCAVSRPWIGMPVVACPSYGLYCEDSAQELHRRQEAINDHLRIRYADLGAVRYASGLGYDNFLCTFSSGELRFRPRFYELVDAITYHRARMVCLDVAAEVFGGDANDKSHVRQFIRLLGRLALYIKGPVLLNAHPSKAGMRSTGDHDGNSIDWNNASRSRWSLERPEVQPGAAPDLDARILTKRKANYSKIGETVQIRWVDGVLVPTTPFALPDGISRPSAASVFLTLLAQRGSHKPHLSASPYAPRNFAPRVFAGQSNAMAYSEREFHAAMDSLFAQGSIVNVPYGRASARHHRIAIREPDYDVLD